LLYGHYDVQPADPLEEWNTKPFEPTVRDGYVYARGSSDDKGQVFAHVVALEHALKAGPLPVNVKLLIEGEEECGSANLDEFIIGNLERLACDVVMISDGSMFAPGVPTLTTGLRGLAYLEVHVQGAKSDLHSGGYGGAVANPLNALAIMIGKLKDENGRILVPGVYDNVRAIPEAELEGWRQLPFNESDLASSVGVTGVGASQAGGEAGFSVLERLWARPTLDVNGIWGGYQGEGSKTVLPAKAGAKISLRLVPDQDPDEIAALVEKYLHGIKPKSRRCIMGSLWPWTPRARRQRRRCGRSSGRIRARRWRSCVAAAPFRWLQPCARASVHQSCWWTWVCRTMACMVRTNVFRSSVSTKASKWLGLH
jgi:acetylornithine deacetylase/succinyl-diaminopimelate desuccinylase-like protein